MQPESREGRAAAAPTQRPVNADQDLHKGATEDDRGGLERSSRPGLDQEGLPNDPVAIGQDAIGANVDNSQG